MIVAFDGNIGMCLLHVIVGIIIFVLIIRIRYELTREYLNIYIGSFLFSRIELIQIISMQLSYNPLSAPAASFKRIAIYYNNWGFTLISPKNREEFIEEVWKRKAQLEINA